MKPFDQLTYQGRIRRIRRLAQNALSQYDLDIKSMRFISMWTNGIFLLQTHTGPSYVLRVCTPGWRSETDLRAEIAWLQALDRDTDIHVPVPMATRSGETLVQASAPGISPCFCMVMGWLPGQVLIGPRLNETNLHLMGALFARLHQHGLDFKPPPGFSQHRMDQVYARGEEDALFAAPHQDAFTPRSRTVCSRAWKKVGDAFARRYGDPAGLRVIHNDLWHENIKVHRGQLYPYDFEDTIWGYPVQDMAMALLDLLTDVEADAYPPLRRAFRAGYESHSTWPETYAEEINTFQVGRIFWMLNHTAREDAKNLPKEVATWTPVLEKFLDTGAVEKP
ncbi:MAG: phosphotransferase [Candidatus Latescibacteria bacterium]|nr:phosphotransferase [Candidatus Latescibacterota bacterium]